MKLPALISISASTILRNENKEDDKSLIALQKLLSPNHLLKVPFTNDSNSLNEKFYKELLHIIGLEEVKEGSKNIIRRKITNRKSGSLLENTINILKTDDSLRRIKDKTAYGDTRDDQLFNIALELCLTWINRVLFLKLLEGQLITYHKGDPDYRFLNAAMITDYDELYKLFHQVLARNVSERTPNIQHKYSRVPYLNSSLFEISDLEAAALKINSLDDSETLELISTTILKDERKKNASLPTLHYLFKFLDAYDFASEGGEDIAEDNKTIINASVLGKVFEKINGYKDGSIFTPGFITMYMSRQSLRPAVIQKFNEHFKTNGIAEAATFEELYNRMDKVEIKAANEIVNSLRVCDPAVGSGHFLVSALNELILIKSELGILADKSGKRLRDYEFTIENDELIITDEHGLFVYNHLNKESQRVQETIFGERQTIIENCLFGVDINPNSVKICRLRLWIELLKSAYYKSNLAVQTLHATSLQPELETLPNIDINIKCGNSLISRYALDADIKKALKRSKWSIDSYRLAVMNYRNARSKDEKRAMEDLIATIKTDFETEVSISDKRFIRLKKAKDELFNLTNQGQLFEKSKKEKAEWNKKVATLSPVITKLEQEIEEIKNNVIYKNAFEWRFEFPEVLNDEGDFVGFDVVIGNPPYISNWDLSESNRDIVIYLEHEYEQYLNGHWDLFGCFIVLGNNILHYKGLNTFILPTSFYKEKHSTELRKFFLEKNKIIELIDFQQQVVFEGIARQTGIYLIEKQFARDNKIIIKSRVDEVGETISQSFFLKLKNFAFKTSVCEKDVAIFKKLSIDTIPLGEIVCINTGVVAHSKKESNLKFTKDDVIHKELQVGYKKYIIGSNLSPYSAHFENDYIDYESKKDHFHRPKFPLLFESEKIIVRRISGKNNRFIAYFDDLGFYSNDNLMHLVKWNDEILNFQKPENKWTIYKNYDISLKFLTAILNSNLCTYYFSKFLSTDTLQGSYSSIYPEDIRQIPIKRNPVEELIIIDVVDQILEAKKQDQDTLALEQQVDELVYGLYGITEEERRVIEGGNK